MASDDDVVPYLHEIINFRAFADNSIPKGPPIDGRVCPDFHVILDDDPANLRHFEVPLAAHGEAKAIPADADASMQDHAVADECVRNRRRRRRCSSRAQW